MFRLATGLLIGCCLTLVSKVTWAQQNNSPQPEEIRLEVLNPQEWDNVQSAIDRGLLFLASQQLSGGSFPAYSTGNPAITSFCVLSFLSQGNLPGEGKNGQQLNQAIRYVLNCQRVDGLITSVPPRGDDIDPSRNPSHTAIYNHAISGLMLCEVYGMTDPEQIEGIGPAIEMAIQHTLNQQMLPKRLKADIGGWRYIRRHLPENADSDLSHTSWQLTFLRAAKNARFDIPADRIKLAIGYVKSRYSPEQGGFRYASQHRQQALNATTGAGILSLSMSGLHHTKIAQSSADWLLTRPFRPYRNPNIERYHYAAFLCSMAMFQMGGQHWEEFYPVLAKELIAGQQPNGSWIAINTRKDKEGRWGRAYTTSLAILALSAPHQLLPIYQR